MTTDTATVATLTAEVRTLVVGSRQVTMSVYEQLDWVDPEYCEPFGRVAHKRRRHEVTHYVYVVGRSTKDGTLVRSSANLKYRRAGEPATEQECEWEIDLSCLAMEWMTLPLIVLAGLR